MSKEPSVPVDGAPATVEKRPSVQGHTFTEWRYIGMGDSKCECLTCGFEWIDLRPEADVPPCPTAQNPACDGPVTGPHAHLFKRIQRWRPWVRDRLRWKCVGCGFVTRHYDSLDGAMGRPVHPHMSVAYRDVNTTVNAPSEKQAERRELAGDDHA